MTTEVTKYEGEKKQAVDLKMLVDGLEIKNEDDFKTGISFVVLGKGSIKQVEDSQLAVAKQKAFEAHKEVAGIYKAVTDGITATTEACLDKMKAYLTSRKTEPEDDRLYYRETWKADVYDIKELCRAISEGEVSADLVKPNTTALNKLAKASKDFLKLAGVKAKKTTSLCFKSAKDVTSD